ncbi:vanillate O-demethylase oxygenase subunit oxidoreductase [Herbaspirillum rubrisubalbicans M1]|uniref:aromatic ring-hydroxylating dioxygenase subunit alpha n=1 Tax=Herbaspirillum rubrisubalbicans TaxID=80842 RepID=UPI00073A3DBF|nr:aromatic ring-hydroxylating dioxygenase subunit alpha [Herbaspirillum rubrisubalbicans]ALU91098.1 vanillate O-demethylase oxygenase subunit oxidoreductase [Herbaspirillum rubrisubalbicans M1]
MFVLNQWYVAGFSWELQERPLARTLLSQPVVLFRTGTGEVAALEDRCCHRSLPLSCGTVEEQGLRCGYHGLLFAPGGQCLEIPGQARVPAKACVKSFPVAVRNQVIWIWMGEQQDLPTPATPPEIAAHDDPRYRFKGGVFHYEAPYQLIHDNLLDLSHVGYVHSKTIGGNAKTHMEAPTRVSSEGQHVRVVRHMLNSLPPATYTAAWPFRERIDRWQEIDFHVSHLNIFTGAVDAGSESVDNPARGGFHMRGFHGITPETKHSSHYFWTMACSSHPDMPDNLEDVYQQTAATFEEDRIIIEAQYRNMQQFSGRDMVDIHVDAGANRARRIIDQLISTPRQAA